MVDIEYFIYHRNLFSGALPGQLGKFDRLQFFYGYHNLHTGPIPSEFGGMISLKELYLHDNHLGEALPSNLGLCTALRVLRLEHNFFSGSLEGVFNKNMTVLENVDLSDNRFSGSIPPDLFELPEVITIALSLNCFEGSLPQSMCKAHNVSVLSMDGLGAAQVCKNSVELPFSGVTLFNTLEGSIPTCVWSLPALQVLHLTGNGLTGSIGDPWSIGPLLETVSLGECVV
jgi:hypothetical protein